MCHIDTLFSLLCLSSLTWHENYFLLTERKQSSGACLCVSSLFIQWVSPQCKIPSSTPCLLPRYAFDLVLAWLTAAIITRKCVVWHVCSVCSAETQYLRAELFASLHYCDSPYKPKIEQHYSLEKKEKTGSSQTSKSERDKETPRERKRYCGGRRGDFYTDVMTAVCTRVTVWSDLLVSCPLLNEDWMWYCPSYHDHLMSISHSGGTLHKLVLTTSHVGNKQNHALHILHTTHTHTHMIRHHRSKPTQQHTTFMLSVSVHLGIHWLCDKRDRIYKQWILC